MLHILRLRIPNVYLLTGDKAILIDTGGPKDVPRILAFLKEHGIDQGKLSLIVVTHGHWDHAGGASALKAATGAPIAIHRGDAELVRTGTNGLLTGRSIWSRFVLRMLDLSYPPFEPDIWIEDETDLSDFGVAARAYSTPGHTAGSVSILTGERALLVGDLLMGGYFGGWLLPRRPGMHYHTGDPAQIDASIRKALALALAPAVIHPGHGGPLDPAAVARRFS